MPMNRVFVDTNLFLKYLTNYKFPKNKIDETISSLVASDIFEIPERDVLLQFFSGNSIA